MMMLIQRLISWGCCFDFLPLTHTQMSMPLHFWAIIACSLPATCTLLLPGTSEGPKGSPAIILDVSLPLKVGSLPWYLWHSLHVLTVWGNGNVLSWIACRWKVFRTNTLWICLNTGLQQVTNTTKTFPFGKISFESQPGTKKRNCPRKGKLPRITSLVTLKQSLCIKYY